MQEFRTDEVLLKRLREQRSMTQIDLAKVLGLSSSWLSRVESGQRSLTRSQERAVAEFFGIPDLRTLHTDRPKPPEPVGRRNAKSRSAASAG